MLATTLAYILQSRAPKSLFSNKSIWYTESMRKIYPSDITREDFEEIRSEMEGDKPAQ